MLKLFSPIFEILALHAPVTFVLQESSVPTYYPQDVISDCALPVYQGSADKNIDIDYVFMINVPLVLDNKANLMTFYIKKVSTSVAWLHSTEMYPMVMS